MSQIKDELVQYEMSTLDRVKIPDVGNIHKVVTQIATLLGDYPCTHADAQDYGHQFLIYDSAVWLTLPNVTMDVIISKPGTLTGTTHAERYVHEENQKIYTVKETHQKGAVRMLEHIFPPAVFLDLQNSQGLMVGKTPRQIIEHLQDSYCDAEEKEDESIKQEENLKITYDPADLPQAYFACLQHARIILVSLKETVQDRKLIHQALTEFNKHVDLHTAVDEWKLKPPAQKTWGAFKIHFTKAIITHRKRGGTCWDIGIANNV